MIDQRKSGDCAPASEIIHHNFRDKNTRLSASRQVLKPPSQNSLLAWGASLYRGIFEQEKTLKALTAYQSVMSRFVAIAKEGCHE